MAHDVAPITQQAPAAKRNWFVRHKIATGVGVFLVLAAIGGATGSDKGSRKAAAPSSTSPGATSNSQSAQPAPKVLTTADGTTGGAAGHNDYWDSGDWGMSKPVVSIDGLGMFDIKATMTYYGTNTKGGSTCVDVLLTQGSVQVASATGCPSNLLPGHSTTVNFLTGASYVSGPYTVQIQKSF
ncbi:MAG TPA: hypothetical protein VHV82_13145 [Sporichthyaceae bacterium]|jgi:hypothetical protein|nr:hypothetical protein [Sporichthyaceae bacterium]